MLTVIIGRIGPKISSVMTVASRGGSTNRVDSMNLRADCYQFLEIHGVAYAAIMLSEKILTDYLHPSNHHRPEKL